jgi:MoxR-like ATPase
MSIDEINENDRSEEEKFNPEEEVQVPPQSVLNQPEKSIWQQTKLDLNKVSGAADKIKTELNKVIIGQEETMDLLLAALFVGGHVLVEGVPGIAKTLTANLLAQTVSVDFSRIQFTPDLMPTDVIGTTVYNLKTSEFTFNRGPIFSNIVLIDEINRAPAKTQSALFEVMEEKQISFDGTTYAMGHPFFVIATQNPIEQEGTYRLPEAQLDRFLMKINLTYPTAEDELDILKRFKNLSGQIDLSIIEPVLNAQTIKESQRILETIHVEEQMMEYIISIVQETRNHSKIYLGASPRSSLAILKTSKVAAIIAGRDYVIPDDIQFVAPHVLNHRLILSPDAEMEEKTSFIIIDEIIKTIEVPR